MNYCNNCGVELEELMSTCPLCGRPTDETSNKAVKKEEPTLQGRRKEAVVDNFLINQKLIWEVISVIIGSSVIVTLLINLIVSKRITWAEYPVVICLVIFFYTSLFAFWNRSLLIKILVSFVASSLLLVIIGLIAAGTNWPIKIALPLLFLLNVISFILLAIIRHAKNKGINLVAYALLGIGVLCLCIEMILSAYTDNELHLSWSLIVFLSILITSIVLLYMHFRLLKGRDLERTFHI